MRLGIFLPAIALGVSFWSACSKTEEAPALTPEQAQCEAESLRGLYPRLSCTGLYSNMAALTIAPAARPFTPGIQFWSDGADKSRFISLPPGEKIDTAKMDEWIFPVGTRVWKEFRLAGKRIETRFFLKENQNVWRRTTYRWNAEETEAFRLDDGEKNVAGTKFEIPEASKCDNCHDGAKDALLGFEAVSLALPTAEGVTLRVLAEEGLLTRVPAKTTLTIPEDGKGSGAALMFLHANCGTSCHSAFSYSPLSYVGLDLRLYAETLLSETPPAVTDLGVWKTTIDQPLKVIANGSPGTRIVRGAPGASAVLFLAGRRTEDERGQMPPIATHVVDETGVNALRQWITALP